MYGSQIVHCLKSNPTTAPYFKGVFSADEFPDQPKKEIEKTKFFIFNLSESDEPGSHWVAIMKNPAPHFNCYFDSYGEPPPKDSNFKHFMKHKFLYNSVQLQSPFSTVCGQWCMFFIAQMCCGVPFDDMVHGFERFKTFLEKDYIINRFVFEVFNLQLSVIDKEFLLEQIQRNREKIRRKNTQ